MSDDVSTGAQDTSEDVERRQVEGWRRMSPDEKAGILAGLTQTVCELALAGIRARHPKAPPLSANLIHHATHLKVDLFVAGGTPLDEQQLRRRREVRLSDGRTLHVHPPEDILLQKVRCHRKGGEVSDRQWRDIRGIIRVQGTTLDRDYLAANAPVLAVSDLLERALREDNARPDDALES